METTRTVIPGSVAAELARRLGGAAAFRTAATDYLCSNAKSPERRCAGDGFIEPGSSYIRIGTRKSLTRLCKPCADAPHDPAPQPADPFDGLTA